MIGALKVVVAEDHAMVRAGLVEIINGFEEFEVVAEASTGSGAVAAAARHLPDAIVLDLDMPDTWDPLLPREKIALEVHEVSPRTKVVVLTMHEDPETVRSLVRAGVSAYLAKTAGPEELRGALIGAGRESDNILIEVPRRTLLGLATDGSSAQRVLTGRELEILARVGQGASNRDLARDLHIAEATVKRHLDRIYKKLDVSSRISAVNRARDLRLL